MNLSTWRNWFLGQHCVIVAPGPSSLEVPPHRYASHWTIATNRALPYAQADFAVCIERDTMDTCWRIVAATSPVVVFTQAIAAHPRTVQIDMDISTWLPGVEGGMLRLAMSPWYAAAVATYMGFERVGLIGVDLYKNRYPDNKFRDEWELAWSRLARVAEKSGTSLCNLNGESRLQAIPKAKWETMRPKA